MYKDFIGQLEKNYTKVFNYMSGQADVRILALIAAQYTLANKQYSGVELQTIIDRLTAHHSFFDFKGFQNSQMITYKIATQIILMNKPVEETILELRKKDAILQQCGFKKCMYRLMSAFFLEDTAHAVRAKNLHEAMRKHHPILTRKSDFPFAVLLTYRNEADVKLRAQTMTSYFDYFKTSGFKACDALQTMTQLLTLFNVKYDEQMAQYVLKIRETLQLHDVEIKKMHYPYLGLLAITATQSDMVEEIVALESTLRQTEALKKTKELALVLAIQKLVRDYIETKEALNATHFTHWTEFFMASDLFISFDLSLYNLFDFQFDF